MHLSRMPTETNNSKREWFVELFRFEGGNIIGTLRNKDLTSKLVLTITQ